MFDELLQSAVAMKRGETEQQRQRFASYSSLFQATLFVDNPAVIAARRFPRLQDRLRVSVELKQLANRTLKGERTVNTSGGEEVSDKRLPPVDSATAAMHQYEASYGVLQYAESAGVDAQGQPWWRTRGLQDRDLTFCDSAALRQDLTKEEEDQDDSRVVQQGHPSSPSLRSDVIQHLVSVLCNYAICVQQVPRYPDALSCATQALREALLWDPSNLRASFLLSKAVQRAPSSGVAEIEAVRDQLQLALRAHQTSEDGESTQGGPVADAQQWLAVLNRELSTSKTLLRRKLQRHFAEETQENDEQKRTTAATDPSASHPCITTPEQVPMPTTAKQRRGEEGGSILQGDWFAQAAQCRWVVAQLRGDDASDDDRRRAADLESQLTVAAAEKLFVEACVPTSSFDLSRPSKEVSDLASRMQISLDDDVVRREVRRHFQQRSLRQPYGQEKDKAASQHCSSDSATASPSHTSSLSVASWLLDGLLRVYRFLMHILKMALLMVFGRHGEAREAERPPKQGIKSE